MNEIANTTVLISGGAGAMGQLTSEYLNSREDYVLSAIYDPNYEGKDYDVYKELTDIKEDLVIEFSPANIINENVTKLLDSDADIIIGSSGLSSESLTNLKKAAINRKIIVIPNFSVGAAYQKIFSNSLSSKFKSVNIIEKHHSKKQDAPSGTAYDLANSLSPELLSNDLEGKYSDVNKVNNKNIYSLRGDEYLAEQIVNFDNDFESFHLEHKVNDRRAYLYGMKVVLDQYREIEGFNLGLEKILTDQINI